MVSVHELERPASANSVDKSENGSFGEYSENDAENELSSEEEEELTEPKFKYKRIFNSTTEIFTQDNASCFAVHPKFIALGTHKGMIYILDHLGDVLEDHNRKPRVSLGRSC